MVVVVGRVDCSLWQRNVIGNMFIELMTDVTDDVRCVIMDVTSVIMGVKSVIMGVTSLKACQLLTECS